MKLEKAEIVLQPIEEPRKGWAKALQQMHENGDDSLLIDDVFDDENLAKEI